MKKTILLNLVVLLVTSALASAATRLVPDEYATIQAAIDAANDGDTVIVAPGTYTGDGNRDIDFGGKTITVRSGNGPEFTIIDCNGTETEPHIGFHINTNSIIAGFTIINGYAREGGAIYCEYSSPTIINCILSNNSAERKGGAIYCGSGSPTIINCIINNNSATGDGWLSGGGGIHCSHYSNVTVINSQINQNSANSGGGIYCQQNSSLTIKNCTINGNLAEAEGGWGKDSSYGGGIYCRENSSLTIVNSTISKNTAKGGDSGGGGISYYSRDAKLIITNSTISDNLVEGGWGSRGGGIFYATESEGSAAFIITDCTVNGNLAKVEKDRDRSYGGGIYYYQGSPIVSKCKISNNSATEGGGIACEQSNPIIAGCIVSGNFSTNRDKRSGGGIYSIGSNTTISNCTIVGNAFFGISCRDGSTTITNSILYYNGNGEWNLVQIEGYGAVTVTYSDIQRHKPGYEPWPGIGNINTDPCFAESCYWDQNGTPRDYRDDLWAEGDYHLLSESPCINAGGLTSYLLDNTDLDGNPRVIGSRIDMGAYEFLNTPPVADAGPDREVYAWIDWIAQATLDGSSSYDEDGQSLTYLWSWTIDGNTYDMNGVGPTIELPVGEYTIELIVNDRIDDSEPNEIVYTVIEPVESRLWIFPRIINRYSRQRKIMAWLRLPEGITKDQIDSGQPLMLYPGGIEVMRQYVFQSRRRVSIFAFFDKAELMNAIPDNAVADNGGVELQVVGRLRTGRYFYGSDAIRIISRRRR